MSLYSKIISIYPELAPDENGLSTDFNNYIVLRDDTNGNGAYIDAWEHPTLSQPTQEQLDAVGDE